MHTSPAKAIACCAFWNPEVLSNTEGVVEMIRLALIEQRKPSPGLRFALATPSLNGEGRWRIGLRA